MRPIGGDWRKGVPGLPIGCLFGKYLKQVDFTVKKLKIIVLFKNQAKPKYNNIQ